MATIGNAIDFGDLSVTRGTLAGFSSNTRGVFAAGEVPGSFSNVIDYVTLSTTGNATDFGDVQTARKGLAGVSNSTRGVF